MTAGNQQQATTTAARPLVMTPVLDIPVTATAALTDKPWGTEIDLRCTYTGAVDGKRDWVLVAIDRSGKSEQIAVWAVVPNDQTKVIGPTSLRSADLAVLEIRNTKGMTLLRLNR